MKRTHKNSFCRMMAATVAVFMFGTASFDALAATYYNEASVPLNIIDGGSGTRAIAKATKNSMEPESMLTESSPFLAADGTVSSDMTCGSSKIDLSGLPDGSDSLTIKASTSLNDPSVLSTAAVKAKTQFKGVKEYKDETRSLNFTEEKYEEMLSIVGVSYDANGNITNLNGKGSMSSLDNGQELGIFAFNELNIRSQHGSASDSTPGNWKYDNGISVIGENDIRTRSEVKFDINLVPDKENETLNPNYPKMFSRYAFTGNKYIYDLKNQDGSFTPSKVVIKYIDWIDFKTSTEYTLSATTNRGSYTNDVFDSTLAADGILHLDLQYNTEYSDRPYQYTNSSNQQKYTWNQQTLTLTGFTNQDKYIAVRSQSAYIYAIDVYYEQETPLTYEVSNSVKKDETRSLNITEEKYANVATTWSDKGTTYSNECQSGALDAFNDYHVRFQYGGASDFTAGRWYCDNGQPVTEIHDGFRSEITHFKTQVPIMEDPELNPDYPKVFSRYSFTGNRFIYDLNNENGNFTPSKIVIKYLNWVNPNDYNPNNAYINNEQYPLSVTTNRGSFDGTKLLDSTLFCDGILHLDIKADSDYADGRYKYYKTQAEKDAGTPSGFKTYKPYELTLTGFTSKDKYLAFIGQASIIYAIDVYYNDVEYTVSGLNAQEYDYLNGFIYYPSDSVCNVAFTDEAFSSFLSTNNITTKAQADTYNAENPDDKINYTTNQLALLGMAVKSTASIGLDITPTEVTVNGNYTGNEKATVLVAAYGEGDVLLNVKTYPNVALNGDNIAIAQSDIPTGAVSLKAFLWTDKISLEPICSSAACVPAQE